jgi:FkbM family methyltransferase
MKQIRGIWLPDDDEHFQHHLEQGEEFAGAGTYQFRKISAALALIPEYRRGLAVDVGAHVGLWSRVLAHTFTRVVAFEPIPDLADCWDANLVECENAELRRNAVSDVAGELELDRVPGNSGNSCVIPPGENWPKHTVITVAAVRLDDQGLEGVDFIKVDVEGYELQVILGAEQLIKAEYPTIVVEQKPENAERYGTGRRDATRLLQGWGASILWEKAGDICLGW